MDKYVFLIISLYFVFFYFLIFLLRKDLRTKLLISGFIGGVAGLLAEFWYFKDYWQPPSILGNSRVSIEEFLFGFAIAGISSSIYDFISKSKLVKKLNTKIIASTIFFLIGLTSLILFNNILKINSIFVSSLSFLIISIIIIIIRKDLLKPTLVSAILPTLLMIFLYFILFNIVPNYWQKYWLLYNTKTGLIILNTIPLTEILWYLCFGSLAGVGYDFMFGLKKEKLK